MFFLFYYRIFLYLFAIMTATFLSYQKMKKEKKLDITSKYFFLCGAVFLNLITPLICQLFLRDSALFFPKFILCMFIGYFSFHILSRVKNLPNILKNSRYFQKSKYGIVFFLFSYIAFNVSLPSRVENWVSVWYGVNYDLGVGPRFFIGSLLHLFSDRFVSNETAYTFCYFSFIFLLFLISYCVNRMLVRLDSSQRMGGIFLTLLYAFSPGFVLAYSMPLNFGRLEVYGYILSLLGLMGFHYFKNIYIKYLILSTASILSLAIYQGFIFLYYPIVLLVMVMDIINNKKDQLKKIFLSIVSVVISCGVFLFFQFFSFVHAKTIEEFVRQVRNITDVNISLQAIHYELFAPLSDIYTEMMMPRIFFVAQHEQLFISLLFLFPMICLFIFFYLLAFRYNKKSILEKPYIYFLLVNFSLLPQFVLNVDWGRWLIVLMNLLFFEVFYLIYCKDSGILYALKIFNIWIKRHILFIILILFYLSLFSYFDTQPIFLEQIKIFLHF